MPRQSLTRNGTNPLRAYLLSLSILLVCQMALGATNCRVASSPVPTPNPHGSLKAPCENCHTPAAWMPIRKNPEFDHNKTAYPLRGMHTKVLCQECHIAISAIVSMAGRFLFTTSTSIKTVSH